MSASWHLHCIDCDESHRKHELEGDMYREQLCALVSARVRVVEVHRAAAAVDGALVFEVGFRPLAGAADFLADHEAHRVVVENEYGDFSGECCKWVKCPHCDASNRCRLDAGHDGDCNPRRPS